MHDNNNNNNAPMICTTTITSNFNNDEGVYVDSFMQTCRDIKDLFEEDHDDYEFEKNIVIMENNNDLI